MNDDLGPVRLSKRIEERMAGCVRQCLQKRPIRMMSGGLS